MFSHVLSPFVLILKAYILEATRAWHIQHEFFDCKCDIVCIWGTMITFSQGGAAKSNPSSFQSLAPGLYTLSYTCKIYKKLAALTQERSHGIRNWFRLIFKKWFLKCGIPLFFIGFKLIHSKFPSSLPRSTVTVWQLF